MIDDAAAGKKGGGAFWRQVARLSSVTEDRRDEKADEQADGRQRIYRRYTRETSSHVQSSP